MRALLDGGYLHEDCITVTGKTIKQNLEGVKFNENQKVVYPVSKAITPTGGVVGLQGSLAPDGAIVKVAGMTKLKFRGPARVFDCEEDCFAAVERRDYKDGDVLIIRYEGPKGGPGMREMLSTTAALYGQGAGDKVALITDGRFSGAYARLLHWSCRSGGSGRGADRAHSGRRHDLDRRRGGTARSGGERGGARQAARAHGSRLPISIRAACCASMRTRWARHARGRSHMQAERRKSFAMRISSGVVAAALIAFAGVAWASQPATVEASDTAFEQGVAAYNAGSLRQPRFRPSRRRPPGATTRPRFFAEFYLARIYSDTDQRSDQSLQGVHALSQDRRRACRRRSRRRPSRAVRGQGADRAGGLHQAAACAS